MLSPKQKRFPPSRCSRVRIAALRLRSSNGTETNLVSITAIRKTNLFTDLRTGISRESRPEDYCMKVAGTWAADPGTPSPRWIEFLNTAMGGDPALVSYLQRVCGYCLTGSIAEHALFFLYGTGANGKSVFINTLRGVFG